MAASYVSRPEYQAGQLVLEEEHKTHNIHTGTTIVKIYRGRPADVQYHYDNRATFYPDNVEVATVENGPFWELHVKEGIQLFSTWTVDSAMHEVRLVASDLGQALDFAFPGWGRFIEVKIDEHFNSEKKSNRFDYSTVKAASLLEVDGVTTGSLNFGQHNATQLDAIVEKYAETYIRGVDVFFEPRWVIRNQVTISAATNLSQYNVLYDHVNWMLSPYWMAGEALVGGEIIPAGIIIPGVNWWHKQSFSKTQTSNNTFIITREWWGINHFVEHLYNKKAG